MTFGKLSTEKRRFLLNGSILCEVHNLRRLTLSIAKLTQLRLFELGQFLSTMRSQETLESLAKCSK